MMKYLKKYGKETNLHKTKLYCFLEENKDYNCVCYYQDKRIENKFISFLKNSSNIFKHNGKFSK